MIDTIDLKKLNKLPKEVLPLLTGGYYSLHSGSVNGVQVDGYILRLHNNKFAVISNFGELLGLVQSDDKLKIDHDLIVQPNDVQKNFIEQLKTAIN
jgi:hypothetical protein